MDQLIQIVVGLAVVGFVLWFIQTMIPMDGKIRTLISAAVGLFAVLYLLHLLGFGGLPRLH